MIYIWSVKKLHHYRMKLKRNKWFNARGGGRSLVCECVSVWVCECVHQVSDLRRPTPRFTVADRSPTEQRRCLWHNFFFIFYFSLCFNWINLNCDCDCVVKWSELALDLIEFDLILLEIVELSELFMIYYLKLLTINCLLFITWFLWFF